MIFIIFPYHQYKPSFLSMYVVSKLIALNFFYLSIYLSIFYLSKFLSIFYQSKYLYIFIYISIFPSIYSLIFLCIYLAIDISNYVQYIINLLSFYVFLSFYIINLLSFYIFLSFYIIYLHNISTLSRLMTQLWWKL